MRVYGIHDTYLLAGSGHYELAIFNDGAGNVVAVLMRFESDTETKRAATVHDDISQSDVIRLNLKAGNVDHVLNRGAILRDG